ncbi:formylglycine-generating enzyme family protein [Devosia sp. RR2S18]|uniref:formylglycine-generating enzyme family protein n=1 Tax=Devosia rhizosphaerae TaxID=3049774 RepID=UPI00253F749E|nr:formylglycine-generating enzyme family protein [Devosia sp. RR2S18]WIJ27011.1 formylglycine-generating enzyme family protein [Devosia sp. RR2S18]
MPLAQSAGPRYCDPIFLKGGPSFVGVAQPLIPLDGEGPERPTKLKDYFLEAATVTNVRFSRFVAETGYVTEAERFGWSAVFTGGGIRLGEVVGSGLSWWSKVHDANWREPEGRGSSIERRMDHPVTHVSLQDAEDFAAWAGGRLPSEAEWEHAARGGLVRRRFPWGDDEPTDDTVFCNIWQGDFPQLNTAQDGYEGTAPSRSFTPSELGFFNMVGNVWEWTAEPFRIRSISRTARQRNEMALANRERLLKGGSFLCHRSYCYRYRIAARMALSADSSASNVGFRIAFDTLPQSISEGRNL